MNKATAFAAALSVLMAGTALAADEVKAHGDHGAVRGDADNTGRNVRDRDADSVTPMDQSNDKGDVAITRRIRKSIVDDSSMSTNARNVKIVTADGKITLRGPVKDEQERAKIVTAAKRAAKAEKLEVDDQLEVERQK